MKQIIKAFVFAALILSLAACSTSKKAGKDKGGKDVSKTEAAANAYKERVVSNFQTAECLSAKASIDLNAGSQNFSINGSLKMKRDDVIMISLTFFGMEVGRIEFTTTDMLVVDKVHKQFVRLPYQDTEFLQKAGLDFYSLQSLFWNEVFAPGTKDVNSALHQFRVIPSGNHTMLSLTSAPELEYSFLTLTDDALLDNTTISTKSDSDNQALNCSYSDFVKFGGKKFPSKILISFNGVPKALSLNMRLSRLSDDSSWSTRTKVPSSYKERNLEDILGKLSTLN